MEKFNEFIDQKNTVSDVNKTNDGNERKKSRGSSVIIFVFSLIAALIFWVYVLGYDSATEEKKIKLVEINIVGETELFESRGYTITESDDLVTDIVVSGKKSVLGSLKNEDVKAYIDVEDIDEEGTVSRQVLFDVPNGVTVKSSTISYYKFDVIRAISQKFRIGYVNGDISFDSTCSLGEVLCSPASVQVTGSETLISQIKRVVVSLDFGDMNSSKIATRSLRFLDDKSNEINVDKLDVSCTSVEVSAELLKTKEIPVIVKTSGYISDEFLDISYSPSTVRVIGEISDVENINDYTVEIDESKINDELTYYKTIYFPNSVKIISEEESVAITASLKGLETKTIVVKPEDITYLNLPSGFSCVLNDLETHIVFKGKPGYLSTFTKDNFICRVNFSGQEYESGKNYDCALEIILPENETRVFTVGGYSVNVTMYKAADVNDVQ